MVSVSIIPSTREHIGEIAKMVRPEFVEKIKQSEHWQQQRMVPNLLREGADIWA